MCENLEDSYEQQKNNKNFNSTMTHVKHKDTNQKRIQNLLRKLLRKLLSISQ